MSNKHFESDTLELKMKFAGYVGHPNPVVTGH